MTLIVWPLAMAANSVEPSWRHPRDNTVSGPPDQEIGDKEISEVVVAKLASAKTALASNSFIALSKGQELFYVGRAPVCKPGTQRYLLRAVYGHRGTGVYSILRYGTSFVVSHSSLGRASPPPTASAVVACLSEEPSEVFVDYDIAE